MSKQQADPRDEMQMRVGAAIGWFAAAMVGTVTDAIRLVTRRKRPEDSAAR